MLAVAQLPAEIEGIGTVGGLSGLVSAGPIGSEREFLVVSDGRTRRMLYRLTIDLRKTEAGDYALDASIDRPIEMDCAPTDSEAIVGVTPGAFGPLEILVGFERPPSVIGFPIEDLDEGTRELAGAPAFTIPPDVADGVRHNRGVEAMAWLDPARDWGSTRPGASHTLWVMMEAALESDGPEATAERGTLCRVLEFKERAAGPSRQYFYETEPAPRGFASTKTYNSVGEMCGLGAWRVLVLERGASIPAGWHAELFVCDGTTETREGLAFPVLVKRRVRDLREAGLPVMGNLEGMAVGATVAALTGDETEEGRVLVMVSDDNFGKDGQVGSQVVVCRLTGGR